MKKPLYVNEKNRAAIEDELSAVQKQAKVRLIEYSDIEFAIHQIEWRLRIPKKYMAGIIAYVDKNAATFPGKYHGIPESTQITLMYKTGGWALIDVFRARVRTPGQRYELILPEPSKMAIISRMEAFE